MATRSKQKALARQDSADLRPKATAKFVRISAFKVRQVMAVIKGMPVLTAIATLENTQKSASEVLLKIVKSALANAENNQNLSGSDLVVAECFANEGPQLKRIHARARGRAARIVKRTSHITVILDNAG
jgi:large subunit ribosomal protein L22